MVARGVVTGMAAGIVGSAAVTVAETFGQRLTGRRNSAVPGRAPGRSAGLGPRARTRAPVDHAMHRGTGMVVGALQGVMSASGLRGPRATLLHSTMRLMTDQTLENAAGVGAPPWAWRRRELVIDLRGTGVYGAASDAVNAITPRPARPVAGKARGRSH